MKRNQNVLTNRKKKNRKSKECHVASMQQPPTATSLNDRTWRPISGHTARIPQSTRWNMNEQPSGPRNLSESGYFPAEPEGACGSALSVFSRAASPSVRASKDGCSVALVSPLRNSMRYLSPPFRGPTIVMTSESCDSTVPLDHHQSSRWHMGPFTSPNTCP